MTDTIVFFGNCQAQVLAQMVRTVTKGRYEPVYVPSVASIGNVAISDDVADRCAILAEQVGVGQAFPFLDRLKPDVTHIKFPPLALVSPWPFSCFDPRNKPTPEFQFGLYPCGDRVALQIWRAGLRGREAVERYKEESVKAIPDIAGLLEKEMDRAALVESRCDIRINEYIQETFRSEWLFYTQNHPSMELIFEFFRRIVNHAGLADGAPKDAVDNYRKWFFANTMWRPFEGYQHPIHPAVAQQLQLKWWHEDLLYCNTRIGRPVTHDEFLEWYLS